MIPVLSVPVLLRDPVRSMLASVDHEVGLVLVVDNGAGIDVPGAHVIHMPGNFGIGASWNLAMKATPWAAWWLHVNDDVTFGPGALAGLEGAMSDESARVVTLCGFSAFAMNRAALETVGWFDENFHPAYLEDCDYERRCHIAGVPIIGLKVPIEHGASTTVRDPFYKPQNDLTYRANFQHYLRKWGGGPRGAEKFDRPFDGAPDMVHISRLADQAWEVK